jgi:hypothetical protein
VWEYYEGGKLDRIGYDTTGSGQVDRWDRAPEEEGAHQAAAQSSLPPAATPPTAATPPPAPPTAPTPKASGKIQDK